MSASECQRFEIITISFQKISSQLIMAEELQIRASALADFVCDGNEALEFRLVKTREDLEDEEKAFKPEMCHQIYGDNENIFGYKGLKVKNKIQ